MSLKKFNQFNLLKKKLYKKLNNIRIYYKFSINLFSKNKHLLKKNRLLHLDILNTV